MLWLGLKLSGSGCNFTAGGSGCDLPHVCSMVYFLCFGIETSPFLCIYLILHNCEFHS